MNYYHELGVGPRSSAKQIRRAYRGLARQLHPDNFQDEARRGLAEKQMQHLNEILDTLTHPEKKLIYDETLVQLELESTLHITKLNSFDGLITEQWETPLTSRLRDASVHWFGIMSGAVLVAASLWYWASGRTQAMQSVPAEPVPVSTSEPSTERAPRENAGLDSNKSQEQAPIDATQFPQLSPAPNTAVEIAEPPQLILPDHSYDQSPVGIAPQYFALPLPPPVPSLNGLWLFVPPIISQGSTNLYVPEYIELLLLEADGKIIGKYTARYRIPDRPISPEVNFRLEGKAPAWGKPLNLDWSSADGAEGQAILRPLTPNSLEMKWWTSKLGFPGTLASGSSQLVRQQNR